MHSARPYTYLLVGAGGMGRVWFKLLADDGAVWPGIEVIGICDVDTVQAQTLSGGLCPLQCAMGRRDTYSPFCPPHPKQQAGFFPIRSRSRMWANLSEQS